MICFDYPIFDDFLRQKSAEGLASLALDAYSYAFSLLIKSDCISPDDPATFTPDAFRDFFTQRVSQWKSSTYNTYYARLHSFCEYLVVK